MNFNYFLIHNWCKCMLSYNKLSILIDNIIWIILIVVFIFFITQSQHFLTERNISNILTAAAVLGVLVVGQTFVLISGNFDLSTESHIRTFSYVRSLVDSTCSSANFGGGIFLNPTFQ